MVECQADVIAKLRMDLEKARLKNESLETQIHELQSEASRSTLTPDEYDDMKRELDNLKTFLFDDGNQKGHKRVSSFSAVHDTSSRQESIVKDDMCVPLADKEDEILRVALAEKTKRVKELQAELTQNGKKSNYSRFSLAAYQDIDNYKSQAEDLGAKLTNANNLITSLGRQIDELSSQKNDALDWIEELFAKSELKDKQVNHANKERDDIIAKYSSLAAEMAKTKQLLEFTIGEKEDATSRMKAMKTEVDALKYCVNANDSVAQGTALLKEQVALLESDVSELKSERDELVVLNDELRSKTSQDSNLIAQLQHTNHMLKSGQGASKHLEELNEELQKEVNQLKRSVQSHQESYCEYKYEKKALLERIDVLEGELSDARATADVKSEELEDVMFSFESEKKAMTKEIVELRGQIQQAQSAQSTSQTKSEADEKRVQFHVDSEQKLVTEQTALLLDQVEEYKNENLSLLARAEQAESELEQIQTTMQAKAFLYESENESLKKEIVDLNEELDSVVSLKEENMKLKSEQFYMKRRIEKTDKEADELRLGRIQLKMAQRAAAESSEALRSTEERMERMEKETYELRTKLEKALQCAAKAEKANNTEQQLRQTQKELSSVKQANITLQRRDKDLRESVSRVRELVDGLASENANLKERNEGYDRKMSEQESRNRELESLVKTLMVERDFAIRKANEVKITFRELKESNKKMQSQFDSLTEARNIALHDKEKTSLKMDQMAGA
jgi:chromosome segregation ATPase